MCKLKKEQIEFIDKITPSDLNWDNIGNINSEIWERCMALSIFDKIGPKEEHIYINLVWDHLENKLNDKTNKT